MRMNISVPDELADQVRTRSLPTSSICQDALREAVEMHDKKERTMTDIQAVVERLRGTQDEERKRNVDEGRELGILWAKEYATADELRQVAEDGTTLTAGMADFYGEVEHHFDEEYADEHNEGFVAGAQEVWDAVKSLL